MNFYKELYLQEHGDDKLEDKMAEILTESKLKKECIHKYQKGMGDESWDFCDLNDTCVEGGCPNTCKYLGEEE